MRIKKSENIKSLVCEYLNIHEEATAQQMYGFINDNISRPGASIKEIAGVLRGYKEIDVRKEEKQAFIYCRKGLDEKT